MSAHPWLQALLTSRKAKRDSADTEEAMEEKTETSDVALSIAKILADAWARFDDGCRGVGSTCRRDSNHFFVRVRSKGWTAGVGYDVVATEASKGAAREWVKTYGLKQSMTFNCSRLGDAEAMTLALEWCARHDHDFLLWLDQPDPKYIYSDIDLNSYVESTEWQDFVEGLAPSSEAAEKAEIVRHIRPQLLAATV